MKQTIRVATAPIQARVMIPGSKSITNRALLLAALAEGVSELAGVLACEDTRVFANALHQLGVVVQWDEANQTCLIGGTGGQFPRKMASIWCGDAGTAGRFLLAACACSGGDYYFDGTVQLRNRPIQMLLQLLCQKGAQVSPTNAIGMPFSLKGTDELQGGDILVDSSQTGQFVSALLMIAPLAKTAFTIEAENLVSSPYVNMTCTMMAEFGVLVRKLHSSRFTIPVPQRYQARNYYIEPDFSTASYFFAAAAITGGQVTMQPIHPMDRNSSKQADIKFLSVLEKMGCEVMSNALGLSVKGAAELQGVSVDMRDFSDTFMTLAALAPFAKTPVTITNIAHTRHKESDRIAAMVDGLGNLKIKVEEGPDWIRIYPGQPIATTINSHHDHRIAMAFSIIGLRTPGIVIEGAECVAKTCPEFFTLWNSLY